MGPVKTLYLAKDYVSFGGCCLPTSRCRFDRKIELNQRYYAQIKRVMVTTKSIGNGYSDFQFVINGHIADYGSNTQKKKGNAEEIWFTNIKLKKEKERRSDW